MRTAAYASKRAMDIAVGLVLLGVSVPLLAVIALLIELDSPGPVLFRQLREGRCGRPFRIHKFRTMTDRAERQGPVMSMTDPRVTRVGRFLRRFSLDELPQFVDVIRGQMSLVGPRPLLPGTTKPSERRRLDMRPGLTSLVEVSEPHLLDWDARMQLDIEYVDRWTMWLDLRILMKTVPVVFTRKDILDLPRTPTLPTPDEEVS
jgi:sugar transferase EpsL